MARDQQAVELLDSHLGRRSSTHDLHQFRPRYEIRDPVSGQHDAVTRRESVTSARYSVPSCLLMPMARIGPMGENPLVRLAKSW